MVLRLVTYLFITFMTLFALLFHWPALVWWQVWLIFACTLLGVAIETLSDHEGRPEP